MIHHNHIFILFFLVILLRFNSFSQQKFITLAPDTVYLDEKPERQITTSRGFPYDAIQVVYRDKPNGFRISASPHNEILDQSTFQIINVRGLSKVVQDDRCAGCFILYPDSDVISFDISMTSEVVFMYPDLSKSSGSEQPDNTTVWIQFNKPGESILLGDIVYRTIRFPE